MTSELKMKTADFRNALSIVKPAIPGANFHIPSQKSVKLESIDGGLAVSASNLDISVRVRMAIQYSGAETAIASERLLKYVQLLDGEELVLKPGDGRVTSKCGGCRATLPTVTGSAAFNLPTAETEISLEQGLLYRALKHISFAIGDDESRLFTTGVLLDVTAGRLNMVATDGHRMNLYEVAVEGSPDRNILMPGALCKTLLGLLSESAGTVTIWWDSSSIGVLIRDGESPAVEVRSGRLATQFPRYQLAIPKARHSFKAPSARMMRGIQRAFALSDQNGAVKTTWTPEGLIAFAASSQAGEAEDVIAFPTELKSQVLMKFNGAYLIDALAKMPAEVTVDMDETGKGAQWNALVLHGEPAPGEVYRNVTMAMNL